VKLEESMALFAESGHPGCPICLTFESDHHWCTLSLVATLPARDLFPSAKQWADRVVEVRDCAGCGRSVARVVAPRSTWPQATGRAS
jgi:hypothetical protein